MSVNNISNNNTAQLQLYTQEKAATAALKQQNTQAAASPAVKTTDSIQISDQAKALLAAERRPDTAVTTLTNGMGIEPPKTSSSTTQTNGMGIEPPKDS
jgi:anti-sigma28 factor (negative regulator of flagellin synthesis)